MKVSIIIPIYNVETYIADCLQSVISQTFTAGVECILIDDCGSDKSMRIAAQMIAGYKGDIQFSIIHHEKNKGLSGARNTGIRAAKGEYLYFLDSDDSITKDCLEKMYSMITEYPDTQIVFAGAYAPSDFLYMDYTKKKLPRHISDAEWIRKAMLQRFILSMTAWNRLVKRSFVIEHNLYFAERMIHEDEIWNFQLSQCLSSISILCKNTYFYNVRNNSIMTEGDESKRLNNRIKLWMYLSNIISKEGKEYEVSSIFRSVHNSRYLWEAKPYNQDIDKIIKNLSANSSLLKYLFLLFYRFTIRRFNFLAYRRFTLRLIDYLFRIPLAN